MGLGITPSCWLPKRFTVGTRLNQQFARTYQRRSVWSCYCRCSHDRVWCSSADTGRRGDLLVSHPYDATWFGHYRLSDKYIILSKDTKLYKTWWLLISVPSAPVPSAWFEKKKILIYKIASSILIGNLVSYLSAHNQLYLVRLNWN
jgi:hypothetical protein